ncbi:non-structural maintenance of chromosomes element 1 homolog [Palaemon carinicauda]|uniref:non-structural maintenance of chromosomes element 1 homolog n=1 Tax=Palaemon carinicauda TaxID=392227 RepID=UPI0035B58668
MAMDNYGDAHRYFLQYITAKRILTASEVKSAYQFCCEKFNIGKSCDLKTFVMTINQHIAVMGLTIKKYAQEDFDNSTQCFLLMNTWNNEATRHASVFTDQELSYIRKLVDALVNSGGTISSTEATNLASHVVPKMKIADGEAFIDRLTKNRWLFKDADEQNVCLSPLAYAELQTYLEETYEDIIPKCVLCKLITFMGYGCPTCESRVHRMCAEIFWKEVNSPFCPQANCKASWNHLKVAPSKRLRS